MISCTVNSGDDSGMAYLWRLQPAKPSMMRSYSEMFTSNSVTANSSAGTSSNGSASDSASLQHSHSSSSNIWGSHGPPQVRKLSIDKYKAMSYYIYIYIYIYYIDVDDMQMEIKYLRRATSCRIKSSMLYIFILLF